MQITLPSTDREKILEIENNSKEMNVNSITTTTQNKLNQKMTITTSSP